MCPLPNQRTESSDSVFFDNFPLAIPDWCLRRMAEAPWFLFCVTVLMRSTAIPAILVACLALAGCSSASGPESLSAGVTSKPSKEITASVTPPPAPVPQATLAATETDDAMPQASLAWEAPVPESRAFSAVTPSATSQPGMPVPSERPVEFAMAAAPAIEPPTRGRSRVYGYGFRDAKPINFGKISPRKLAVHGVDVSRWQGDIDWETLRTRGANFAFIKATDGGDHLDPMFKTNWRRAKEAGIKRGAYHFFYWCRTAGEQADWFIRNVPRDPDALPPVIDVEWNGESSCKVKLSRARVLEKCRSSWKRSSAITVSARSSIRPRISTRIISKAPSRTIISGCEQSPSILRRSIRTANGSSGNIPVRACRMASKAASTSMSSAAARTNGTAGWPGFKTQKAGSMASLSFIFWAESG